MKGAVPGSLESEHGPVIPRNLEDLSGEEAEGEDGAVFVIINHRVGRCSDPANHQLPDVAPAEVSPLVNNGQPDPPLETVMEEKLASTREVIRVIHQDRHVFPDEAEIGGKLLYGNIYGANIYQIDPFKSILMRDARFI